jgi:hypothetical protein
MSSRISDKCKEESKGSEGSRSFMKGDSIDQEPEAEVRNSI